MAVKKLTRTEQVGEHTETVHVLRDLYTNAEIEVWPSFGFNCLRWKVPTLSGEPGDLIFCDPNWKTNPVPTRSGHPILFPFPNRLRHGQMTFQGKRYQLPLNEASGQHAIHGFTPKTPWEVVPNTAPDTLAGQFHLSKHRPDLVEYWPADFRIQIEYQFKAKRLRVISTVQNLGQVPLPFGLGYHPYFGCPNAPGCMVEEMILKTTAQAVWPLVGGLPTGKMVAVPAEEDFRSPRLLGRTEWDTLFGQLNRDEEDDGLAAIAWLGHQQQPGVLSVWVDDSFEELLLFTPPHRQAVALEPYTCPTNAIHLAAEGVQVGWRELPMGETWSSVVEYRWDVQEFVMNS